MVVSIKPLFFYVSEMAVRPLSLLPRPSKGPDGSSTRLGAQDTSYGWTGGDDEAANYTPQTTFRIFPNALVGKSVECDLRMEGRTCKVVLEVATILSKSAVMTQCQDQVQDALLWANGVSDKVLYSVLYCIVHCTVLYCTVLYCTALYCTVLYSGLEGVCE